MNAPTKPKQGGARIGAGRPPLALNQRKVGVSFRVSPLALARLRAFSRVSGDTQAQLAETWMQSLKFDSDEPTPDLD